MPRRDTEHERIKALVRIVGSLLGYNVPEKEYNPSGRIEPIDVVWLGPKEDATPRLVFEIHRKGELDKACRKLKDAKVRWGCGIRIVTSMEKMADIRARLEESYDDLDVTLLEIEVFEKLAGDIKESKAKLEQLKKQCEEMNLPWYSP